LSRVRAKPSWIEVEIDSVAVDDPTLARPGQIAASMERELTRLAAFGGVRVKPRAPVSELSAPLGRESTTTAVGTAIARALAQELAR
jgi:hypothetical protein